MSSSSQVQSARAGLSRRRLADAIRVLAMDAVQRANSGHPGMPMGMADIAEVLWNDYLRFSPTEPRWWDRDRFVLSNGHGSMLLYSLAWLTGYAIDIEEVKAFRQLGSRTAGHPEHEPDIGIETTTGPLGQGLANAVGMALAEKILAATFNRPGHEIVDHYTYVFVGDGCLMEGISHEVCSLAGTLGLGKLVAFYDDNGISIDGPTAGWFSDDTAARFRAYGWQVIDAVDGHDPAAVTAAIDRARADAERPTLICCRTIIGWGAPNKQGTASTHGEALGEDEIAATRERLGWEHPPFVVPDDIRGRLGRTRTRPCARSLLATTTGGVPRGASGPCGGVRAPHECAVAGRTGSTAADEIVRTVAAEARDMATRKGSHRALEGFAPLLPELVGGSADLTGSNNTWHSGSRRIDDDAAWELRPLRCPRVRGWRPS